MSQDAQEIAQAKIDGGSFTLTATHLQQYRDGGAVGDALIGSGTGLLGGLIGGVVKAVSKAKPHGDPIPLGLIRAARVVANKKSKGGSCFIAFMNGKESEPLFVHDVPAFEGFVAQVNQQVGRVRTAASTVAPAPTPAPVTLDPRVKGMPGWDVLPQWSNHSLRGEPPVVHFSLPPGTSESLFVRSAAELGNGTVRIVYCFPNTRSGYLAVRLRSDGKSYAVVRLNPNGEYQVSTNAEKGPWTRDATLHADPAQWNEARFELAGNALRIFFNGALAATVDGRLGLPSGRVVLTGFASEGGELVVGALEIAPPAPLQLKAALTLDPRVKGLPGWEVLQQWANHSVQGDPPVVHLALPAGTTESAFIRTKAELGDGMIRLVYRFPMAGKFAYAAVRLRSDGKTYAMVVVNSKGEVHVRTHREKGPPWTRHASLHTDPVQWNEARIELAGSALRLSLNGAVAVTMDGIDNPTGRVVLLGSANPEAGELVIGALEVHPTPAA